MIVCSSLNPRSKTGDQAMDTIKDQVLTNADRCDSCSAQALVRVAKGDAILDFCYHHYTKNVFFLVGWDKVEDNRGDLR